MERRVRKVKNHYILCGADQVGTHVVNELRATKRQYVVVDVNRNGPNRDDVSEEASKDELFIEGNATHDVTLQKAGIENARGLFATTGDDNLNIVICLTAKSLNPRIRIVARCNEAQNEDKLRKAGADSVVAPGRISGLRIASEMFRQTVVSFLDIMMRDQTDNLRIEEIAVPASAVGKTITSLDLKRYHRTLLLAVKTDKDWHYNPPDDYTVQQNDVLVLMTTAEGRHDLEQYFIA